MSADRARTAQAGRLGIVGTAAGALLVAGCAGGDSAAAEYEPAAADWRVEVVTDELEHGWGIGVLPDGRLLVSERGARLTLLSDGRAGAEVTRVDADLDDVVVAGEGGLLGLAIDPDFAENRRFITCQNHEEADGALDVRLVSWELSADGASATRTGDVLTGLPAAEGGRHSGCRPAFGPDGELLVGTGDSAQASVPQDLGSLGGKVLRLDADTGEPWPGNPFEDAADENQRYVLTYGHRNVQGVAIRPGTEEVWTAEHGPGIDDEVNVVEAGGNYGWDPSRGGTTDEYDESVPMTDTDRFPDAVEAAWSSGDPTAATSALTFLQHRQWGADRGSAVVTALKGSKLLLMDIEDGEVVEVSVPEATDETFGRLRAAEVGPDGALYVTTSNGADDQLLRITPTQRMGPHDETPGG